MPQARGRLGGWRHRGPGNGLSKSYYAREAILERLEDLEDIYLAEQALEQVRRGEMTTHNLDEVERNLGLAD
ncbi:type II toxin-antitoxin system RelB family antitoxin [Halomonas sp. GXIMD04776]|uniref:type II toxin-antitoxin system RelB family antitoxin n=1 Tax=Halomonas sp. GXIMD04776 TaxID=3415605 RepID=UPI003CB757D4